jgi:hypothetical protein
MRVVDLVMHRTLGDLAVDQGTLDELLIRIPKCEHIFTVETLDGHCGMNEYYRREGEDGKWLGLKTPPHGFKKPPVCPTCRVAITSPRYGRIFKRADLDILEVNVASRMSRSLNQVSAAVNKFSKADAETSLKGDATIVDATSGPASSKAQGKSRSKSLANLQKQTRDTPLSLEVIDPGNKKFHDISPSVVKVWKKANRQLMDSYRQAASVAATRSAHINAWEAAFSCLYQQEMERSAADPAHAPRKPAEHAMRVAKMSVGQPQPRADKQCVVEAIWWTLRIRFTLADLAQTWLKLVNTKATSYPIDQLKNWATFGSFLIDTCSWDARIAFEIAQKSESRRQMTLTSLFVMRAELEHFRYKVEMLRQSGTMKEERNNMVTNASQKVNDVGLYIQATLKAHRALKPTPEEESWLTDNFAATAQKFLDEWREMERTLRLDTFYQPVSLEEQTAIVKSFNFCEHHI